MDVYGLTGGIGSGKSTVASLLEEYGVPVVSADELARIVVARGSKGLEQVVETFGAEVLNEHGELNRRKVAQVVFNDADRRRQLENLLHPLIRERYEQVLDALEKGGHDVAIYEVPLLLEKNLQNEMKGVILVTASDDTRIARVRQRDDLMAAEIRARMATQLDEATKRKRADYVIDNNGSLDDLRREVEFLIERYLRIGIPRDARPSPTPSPQSKIPTETPPPSSQDTAIAPPPRPETFLVDVLDDDAVPPTPLVTNRTTIEVNRRGAADAPTRPNPTVVAKDDEEKPD